MVAGFKVLRPAGSSCVGRLLPRVLRKAPRYVAVFVAVLSMNFTIPRLMPGDPVLNLLGEDAAHISPELLQQARRELGLDGTISQQYLRYLANMLTGKWGTSFRHMRPVSEVVGFRLMWTLLLLIPSLALGWLLAVVFGALAAWNRGSRFDAWATSICLFLHATPQHWLAMVCVSIFGLRLGIFPLSGVPAADGPILGYLLGMVHHSLLPLAVLATVKGSYGFLIVRNSVVTVLGEDFVLVALSKGLSKFVVLFKHALRNAIAPVVTAAALHFGHVVSGALMVEVVFSWPGMGTLIFEAVRSRDYPVLQAAFLVVALCVIAANLLVDLVYPVLQPRIKES